MKADFYEASEKLLEDRLESLRTLTFDEVQALPETSDHEVTLAGYRCHLTEFAQTLVKGKLLLTIQVAKPEWFGLCALVQERGLIFTDDGQVREATLQELIESGG